MPRRYRKKKKNRRRKKRQMTIFDPTYDISHYGYPTSKVCKFRYHENIEMGIGVGGACAVNSFRANGPYDPNATGVGHQPMGWDTYTVFYKRYTVLGAKITVTFTHDEATASAGMGAGGIMITSDTTVDTSPSVNIEQGNSKWCYFLAQTDSPTFPRVTHTYSPKQFFSIEDVADNEARIGALTTGNPAQQAYFNVWTGSPSGDDMPGIRADVIIEYTVLFSQPEQQVAS